MQNNTIFEVKIIFIWFSYCSAKEILFYFCCTFSFRILYTHKFLKLELLLLSWIFAKQIQISTKFGILFVPCRVMHFVYYTRMPGQGWAGAKLQLHYILWGLVPREKVPFLIYMEGTIRTSGGPNEQDFPDKILIFRKHYAMLKAKRNPQSKKQIKTHM